MKLINGSHRPSSHRNVHDDALTAWHRLKPGPDQPRIVRQESDAAFQVELRLPVLYRAGDIPDAAPSTGYAVALVGAMSSTEATSAIAGASNATERHTASPHLPTAIYIASLEQCIRPKRPQRPHSAIDRQCRYPTSAISLARVANVEDFLGDMLAEAPIAFPLCFIEELLCGALLREGRVS